MIQNPPHSPPKTVVVGLSGGVDSSVAALLLKQQGYRVIGVFMKNWDEKDENGVCTSAADWEDVQRVASMLDIPCYSVEFVSEYRDHVFRHFLEQYQAGLTPNPDVLCNREIKFNAFYKKALEFGADYLATGHYCQTAIDPENPELGLLLKAADPSKDQTYFLHAVEGRVLSRVLFPIGHLLKSEVRRLAEEAGLPTARKKDSTGICFIGERNFGKFLSQFIAYQRGKIMTLSGEVVGEHPGVAYFTLGQRKGLGLGGEGDPWFVVDKDPQKNIVYVERGNDHPALYSQELEAGDLTWVAGSPPKLPLDCAAKARYRQGDQECRIDALANGRIRVSFKEPQRALTPGQFAVFYQGDRCLGGGVIQSVLKNKKAIAS